VLLGPHARFFGQLARKVDSDGRKKTKIFAKLACQKAPPEVNSSVASLHARFFCQLARKVDRDGCKKTEIIAK
jgi:hypothetical protein